MPRSASRCIFTTALVALLLGLTGCMSYVPTYDPPTGGAAIQSVSGSLVVAACRDVKVISGYMSGRPTPDADWKAFWTFTADFTMHAGDTVSTDPDVTAPFSGETRSSPRLDPGAQLDLLLNGKPTSIDAMFTIPADGLPTDGWLQLDGDITPEPCP